MAAGALFLALFAKEKTHGFTVLGIASNRPYTAKTATRPLSCEESAELAEALSQPYTYLCRGAQTFVFQSEDGRYVVKFLEQRIYKHSKWLNLLPFFHRYRDKCNAKRDDKLRRDFFSYKIAFDELSELTGLVQVHLHRTSGLYPFLDITDPLGIHHQIPLDEFDFLVQKRAQSIYGQIDAWMQEGAVEKAEQGIASIFSLIEERAQKGLRDRDPDIATNCGFLDGKAIKVDVGRLTVCDTMDTQEGREQELLQITAPLGEWLEKHHPQLAPFFNQKQRDR